MIITVLLVVLGMAMSSCNRSVDVKKDESVVEPVVEMSQYNDIVYKNKDLLFEWAYSKQSAMAEQTRASDLEERDNFKKLKNKLLPSAVRFVSDLNISKFDIEEMTGEKINSKEELEDAFVGLMLFASMVDRSIIDDPQTKGGSFVDCFLEATNISGGIVLIGALTRGTMTKKAIKAVLKMVVKTGVRGLCGVGLALIAAEIAWCMW